MWVFEPQQWRLYIVKFWTRVPSRSNFLHFYAVFSDIWANNRLAPSPLRLAPPFSEKYWIHFCAVIAERHWTLELCVDRIDPTSNIINCCHLLSPTHPSAKGCSLKLLHPHCLLVNILLAPQNVLVDSLCPF